MVNGKATGSWRSLVLAAALGALAGCGQEMPPSPGVDAAIGLTDAAASGGDAAVGDPDAQPSGDAGSIPDGGCPVLDGGVVAGDRDGGCPLPDAGLPADGAMADASSADGMS